MSKLFLYGAGKRGQQWIEKLGLTNVYAFIDENAKNISDSIFLKYKKKVYELGEILDLIDDDSYIFVTVLKKQRIIMEELNKHNLSRYVVKSPFPKSILRCGELSDFDVMTEWAGNNYIGNNCSVRNSVVGWSSYIADNTCLKNVKIGKYSSIGCNVSIISGNHPSSNWVSTHPIFYSINSCVTDIRFAKKQEYIEKKLFEDGYSLHIGNDVWIGAHVKIFEGVKIGDGAIIAAGAVVVKDVEPYAIVGGVPAKLIRYRFEKKQISALIKYRWWDKKVDWLRNNADKFKNIDDFMELINNE